MTSWAKWTVRTALIATGFAAACAGSACPGFTGAGFTGAAFAGTGGSDTGGSKAASVSASSVSALSVPVDTCGNGAAVLGAAPADCRAHPGADQPGPGRGSDSFVALAIGALLAGGAALKPACRRREAARDVRLV